MSQKEKSIIAVGILPWAGLREEVKIGPVILWSWDPSKVQDENIKSQLERFFKIFVDHYGKPVNTIVICSHGKPDFRKFDEKEYNELLAAINILAFSAICTRVKQGVCSDNNTIAPPTAECYDFFGQTFKIPNDRSVVVSTRNSANFEDIDKVHVSIPWGLSSSWGVMPNIELLGAFDKVFDCNFPPDIHERLFRSLEWFRLAHTEANNVSDASRLVMMSTAFEILLDFPEQQKSIYFASQIENKLKKDGSVFETRTHKNNQYSYTKAAWWAYDFYQLRNKIVHGGCFNPEDGRYKDWINYNIISDLVFWELVVKELFDHNCLGERARKWAKKCKTHVKDDENLEEFFLNWTMGFEDYHKALDWIEP